MVSTSSITVCSILIVDKTVVQGWKFADSAIYNSKKANRFKELLGQLFLVDESNLVDWRLACCHGEIRFPLVSTFMAGRAYLPGYNFLLISMQLAILNWQLGRTVS